LVGEGGRGGEFLSGKKIRREYDSVSSRKIKGGNVARTQIASENTGGTRGKEHSGRERVKKREKHKRKGWVSTNS